AAQGRRLAAPRRAEKDHEHPVVHRQRGVVDGDVLVEAFDQIFDLYGGHSSQETGMQGTGDTEAASTDRGPVSCVCYSRTPISRSRFAIHSASSPSSGGTGS